MSGHLLNRHSIDTSKKDISGSSSKAGATVQSKLKFGGAADALNGPSRDDIIFKLALWLANSFRPYTTVEDPDFRELVSMLRPGFQLPKRDKIRSVAKKISILIKAQVLSWFSFVVNFWFRSKRSWTFTPSGCTLLLMAGHRVKAAATLPSLCTA